MEAVLMGLRAAERAFGATVNSKGYKVTKGVGVIQGDGINFKTMAKILDAVLGEGYSAESVTFGMGGGLLQKVRVGRRGPGTCTPMWANAMHPVLLPPPLQVNRDTMSFATKLSFIHYADGREADIMKMPTTDSGKFSLPGILQVRRVKGVPTVFPADYECKEADPGDNLLKARSLEEARGPMWR